MKLLKRILLIAIPLLAILAVAGYFAVRAAFPPEKIAAIVREEGTKALGREVKVGSVGITLFPRLGLRVRDVSLANDTGFSNEPALALKSLDLSVGWLSLLTFSPRIHQIRLVEPDILYEVAADGRDNLASLGGPKDSTKADTALPELPASVALESFAIENGRVRYHDLKAGTSVTLGRIDQSASLSLDKKLTDIRTAGELTISEISVSDKASGLRKGGVKITVSHDLRVDLPGDSLRINRVDIGFQDIKAHVEGSLKAFTSPLPVADIRVSAPAISLASLFAEVPKEISPELARLKVAGTASFEARVKGVLDTNSRIAIRAVSADISVRDGSFGHGDVPQGVEGFRMNLAVRGDSVRLDTLSFRSGPNPFGVSFLVTGALDSIPYLRSLKVGGELDYGNLTALAHKMEVLDPKIRVSGRQTFRLAASGPLDATHPERLVVNGRSELIGISVQVPDLPAMKARGIATFTNENIRQQLTVNLGKSDLAVDATVRDYLALLMPESSGGRRAHAAVDVRSSVMDLDELLPKSGSDAPDTSAPLKRYPDWPPLDADVTVTLARTRLMNLDMTGFSLKSVVRAKSAVTDLKGSLYTGGFSSSLAITPKDTTDWGVGFKLKVDKVEANDFISRLNDRIPLKNKLLRSLTGTDSAIFGKFNLNLDLNTRGLPDAFANNLSGPILFSITDGRLVGVEWTKSLSSALAKVHSSLGYEQLSFSELKGDLLAQDGKLLVRDLSFDSQRAGAAKAAGAIGFDNSLNLTLTQALPPSASGFLAGAGSALLGQLQRLAPGVAGGSLFPTDAQGRALIYYTVKGDVSSPRFALDAKRMASEGAGNAAAASAKEALRAKAEAEGRARLEAEKKKLEEQAAAEKKKLQDKAAAEAKKKAKKVLQGLGK
ncbi:MAG TPA: AsmA family protein [Fibrobacteria bacterium]|nr:AsmA family protein [Fibrobacteria bacterium]